ncbi:phosphate ABC transporter ATP-binding protein PstB [Natrinema salifodinae]|uniref:Phosphate ABC transporter ATP-binding protein, PhoT family n=2 Tax=Natrinema salifodinae TaxID=1202768 RepID=A0A1I0LZJ5_9EURY|nr:phosphate ABC transporter ATP-binding protein PstB [Natrinema salifodinae]SEV80797.1 phosphate ABC transporter ATP-binding protein, PhoT family [Natrinema salifodinae]
MTRNDTPRTDDSDAQRTDEGAAVSETTIGSGSAGPDSGFGSESDAESAPLLDESFDVGERSAAGTTQAETEAVIEARTLDVYYDDHQALRSVDIEIPENRVTALIGPSGCGKSTFLRSINRMNDLIDAARMEGELLFDGKNVYDEDVDPVALRRKIGMVFQSPNPFPKSIYDNVAFGLEVQNRDVDVDETVHSALERAALLDEVEDQLDGSGLDLSGGQQQRLCIARAIAPDPEVILMDEPASALDPVATSKIEDLIEDLSEEYTVVIVTHNMQQAARISDKTAVFLTGGELVEFDDTNKIFENPDNDRVEDYITGKFG